jgi:hypothetical protein
MKPIAILLLSFTALFSLTQCNSTTPEMVSKDPAMRGKMISNLVNNEVYMQQVMDSMAVQHSKGMGKHEHAMNTEMMDKMMAACQTDSTMCKKMMSKTMDMCEADQAKCAMMMGAMQGHPKVMKSRIGATGIMPTGEVSWQFLSSPLPLL